MLEEISEALDLACGIDLELAEDFAGEDDRADTEGVGGSYAMSCA